MNRNLIAAASEVPPVIADVVTGYVEEYDRSVAANLAEGGFPTGEVERLCGAWSALPLCAGVSELTDQLVAAGVTAETVVNYDAYTEQVETDGDVLGIKSSLVTQHFIVKAQEGSEIYYIDPYYQQFVNRASGQTIDDIEAGHPWAGLPEERVLCYQAPEMDDVAEWFGQVVRRTQDRHKLWGTAVEGSDQPAACDTFTREVSLAGIMLGVGNAVPAADYHPVEIVEELAAQIWNPLSYRTSVERRSQPGVGDVPVVTDTMPL